jgi:hypothetical protein
MTTHGGERPRTGRPLRVQFRQCRPARPLERRRIGVKDRRGAIRRLRRRRVALRKIDLMAFGLERLGEDTVEGALGLGEQRSRNVQSQWFVFTSALHQGTSVASGSSHQSDYCRARLLYP